jgi:hypothetical protein
MVLHWNNSTFKMQIFSPLGKSDKSMLNLIIDSILELRCYFLRHYILWKRYSEEDSDKLQLSKIRDGTMSSGRVTHGLRLVLTEGEVENRKSFSGTDF